MPSKSFPSLEELRLLMSAEAADGRLRVRGGMTHFLNAHAGEGHV
jgi:hypothetical protein